MADVDRTAAAAADDQRADAENAAYGESSFAGVSAADAADAAASLPLLMVEATHTAEHIELAGLGRRASVATERSIGHPFAAASRLVKRFSTGHPGHSRNASSSGVSSSASPFEHITPTEVHEASAHAVEHDAFIEVEAYLRGIGISATEAEVYAIELVGKHNVRHPEDLEGISSSGLRALNIPYLIHRNLIAYSFPRVGMEAGC